jgi:hypothetical protein
VSLALTQPAHSPAEAADTHRSRVVSTFQNRDSGTESDDRDRGPAAGTRPGTWGVLPTPIPAPASPARAGQTLARDPYQRSGERPRNPRNRGRSRTWAGSLPSPNFSLRTSSSDYIPYLRQWVETLRARSTIRLMTPSSSRRQVCLEAAEGAGVKVETPLSTLRVASHDVVVSRRSRSRSRPASVRRFSLLSRREALTTAAIRSRKRPAGAGRTTEARLAAKGMCAWLITRCRWGQVAFAGQAAGAGLLPIARLRLAV